MATNPDGGDSAEILRIKHAFWLAIVGLILAAVLAIFLVIYGQAKLNTSADVVAIVGLFTSVTGTLVGAFFGLQVGVAGLESERDSRREAETLARMALAHLEPGIAKTLTEHFATRP